jgi:hypothetical protein
MNQDGPELRDIHLPADPAWWPPAPGWWLLAILLLGLVIWLFRMWRRRVRQQRWMTSVRAELQAIAKAFAEHQQCTRLAADVSTLLRRASLLIAPNAVALNGKAWLVFLDQQIGGDAFQNGVGRVLIDAPYRRHAEVDVDALIALSDQWLQRALAQRSTHV